MGLPGGLSLLKSLLSGRKWATWCAATPLLGDPGAARSRQSAMEIELFASDGRRFLVTNSVVLLGVPFCIYTPFHRPHQRERKADPQVQGGREAYKGPAIGAMNAGKVQACLLRGRMAQARAIACAPARCRVFTFLYPCSPTCAPLTASLPAVAVRVPHRLLCVPPGAPLHPARLRLPSAARYVCAITIHAGCMQQLTNSDPCPAWA